ncbi:uncharacterized protein ATNIH1004_004779 [Aspergillus tanneri]|uniref:Uncharacterized protein n=1 Tax=Aspergillus tanneri TaxID=1220188 RepID=A0A5M9MPA8_9EURO|nr:uncharacterized protein ATNIH1004_004779 [Aspergillus tanneri]KAA8648892.1 hypothetical protein ATNIH1004_004779 [Aspergillus tanneri]
MSNTPLRLFSLDDGYPTAISQLVILLGLMRSIQIQNALPSPLSPHEVFDLIGATGHGELNALLDLARKVSKKRKLQEPPGTGSEHLRGRLTCLVHRQHWFWKALILELPRPGFFQRLLPTKILSVLEALACDAEQTANEMDRRLDHPPDLYIRFNVGERFAGIGPDEWKQMSRVEATTMDYLGSLPARAGILSAASSLSSDVGICTASNLPT